MLNTTYKSVNKKKLCVVIKNVIICLNTSYPFFNLSKLKVNRSEKILNKSKKNIIHINLK